MADAKLSALPSASDTTGAVFYGVQGGTSKKFAASLFGSGDASDIAFTPAGGISATDVQAAIEELDGEKLSVTAAAAGYQPLDSDLTAIAGLSTTTFGRSLLTQTAAEDARNTLDVAPYVATRTALKALDTTKDTTAVLTEDGRSGAFTFRAGDYSTQIAADTAEILYVKATAIAATAGAWVRQGLWYFNGISVRWAGAVADGTTDDKAAIQAALDLVKALGFQHLHFPGSPTAYKITGSLTYDISGIGSGRFDKRLKITGDGPASTAISMTGVADEAFEYIGANPSVESSFSISGLRITGNNTVGSTGLKLTKVAFASTDHLIIEAFDYNLDCTDVEQTQFSNSNFRWGLHGVRFNASGGTTSPNSLNFFNCAIANNSTYGALFTNANAVNFVGGSVQYNGSSTGDSGHWGIKFSEAGDGYGTVNFIGTAIEGNTGLSDFIADQSTNVAVFNFVGNGFVRPNSSSYSTNFIALLGTAAIVVTISGNTFRGYGTYSANAARPYFALTNTSAQVFDRGDNVYGSATEQPSWAGKARVPVSMVVGAGGSPIGTFAVHTDTDKNLYVANNFTLSSGIAFGSINDANNSLQGMEFRAGEILFTAASGIRSSGGALGYKAGAGGAVTQATSKSTGVTLSKATGQITMNGAALAAATIVSFTLTNTQIAAGDVLILNHVSGGTPGAYTINAQCGAGSATINVRNNTAGSLSEAIVIGFALIKAVAS